ncbi:MAG TPA: phosphoribulokinase [Chloroflexia bacterium]|nr:phosphoribulokinase [Chloroflexia bacterium]
MAGIATKLFSKKGMPVTPQRPILLGIVGDSGCGKSTLSHGLKHLLGRKQVTEICLDDYHRYDRAERASLGLTPLNPAANNLELMYEQLSLLRQGKSIKKPVYDHSNGRFATPATVKPRPFILVHGLLAYSRPELADLFDLKIFLDPQESLRLEWKMARDTRKRGYTLEEVEQQIEERRPDSLAYISPQKSQADLIINFYRPLSLLYNPLLAVRLTPGQHWQWPSFQLDEKICWKVPAGRAVEISGNINLDTARKLAEGFSQNFQSGAYSVQLDPANPLKKLGLYSEISGNRSTTSQSSTLALTQLLIAGQLLNPFQNAPQSRVA